MKRIVAFLSSGAVTSFDWSYKETAGRRLNWKTRFANRVCSIVVALPKESTAFGHTATFPMVRRLI